MNSRGSAFSSSASAHTSLGTRIGFKDQKVAASFDYAPHSLLSKVRPRVNKAEETWDSAFETLSLEDGGAEVKELNIKGKELLGKNTFQDEDLWQIHAVEYKLEAIREWRFEEARWTREVGTATRRPLIEGTPDTSFARARYAPRLFGTQKTKQNDPLLSRLHGARKVDADEGRASVKSVIFFRNGCQASLQSSGTGGIQSGVSPNRRQALGTSTAVLVQRLVVAGCKSYIARIPYEARLNYYKVYEGFYAPEFDVAYLSAYSLPSVEMGVINEFLRGNKKGDVWA
ncbi:uncharacterized protein EV420DRAFT_1752824 [Desarmillaria tabescens]|uniref:Uncharacterized protein n=1 Tax=Armillaria tabescens TaxID=1929756 RepID=A0AA39JG89_ARMTA|nr:uncharacterized protein EV420DRAFT_1752824 [Desarmillaria tabescens]KAK0439948.1 hypothetical protein EV420DRAFT_1752824 [Desarmillaria tabescens]